MRMKSILKYFRKNTADNLTFNVTLVNGDLEVVNKLVQVVRNSGTRRPRGRGSARGDAGNPPADAAGRRTKTPEAGALKTPVSK